MENKVLGVIVTYNPDIELLHSNLDALLQQTNHILVYDNGSTNQNKLEEMLEEYPSVKFIENNDNLGLPVCYNKAMTYGIRGGYGWILILDQDTVLPKDYLVKAQKYFCNEQIAIICPVFWDINAYSKEAFEKNIPKGETLFVKQCISSGSLVRISCLKELGGFDEAMFIDYVDYDYCRTVIDNGLSILQINSCIMQHQIGNSRLVSLLGRTKMIHNHSGLRKYYFFRNRMYYGRKHHLKFIENRGFYRGFITHLILIFYEENALEKFGMSIKGIFDGLRMPLKDSGGKQQ